MKLEIQPATWPSNRPFRRPGGRQGLLAAALIVALAACSRQGGEAPPQGPPTVGIWSVEERSVAVDVELPGRTSPYAIAEVRPQVGGLILKRLFSEGSDVKEGQALYQIDPTRYQANQDSARAALAQAEANLVTTRLKAERYKQLAEVKAIGQQESDDAAAAYKSAVASVQSAKAALDLATINLKYTHVYAPVAGRIGKSSVTQGALVTAEQTTPLATVQQLDPIYVDVTRSSGELLQIKRELAEGALKKAGENAASVKLILEDNSEYPLEGKLQFADVTVNESTGAVTLRAIFPNPKHDLLPGMFVRARLVEGVNEKAILVPQESVIHDSKGNSVAYVVDAENKVQPRTVQTPRALGNQWLVSNGLKAGDRLVVDGLQTVAPGLVVKPVPAGAKAAEATERK